MDYKARARQIPLEDRPIPENKLSGIGNFFGLYGGEHIAATEFVIGATMATFGVRAADIFIGLIIGNILATLTYALMCAPIAVDTRVTLYTYLGKVLGKPLQKIYTFIWGLASIAMASAMLTISASAVREVIGIKIQTEWYPTDIKFVFMVIILGAIVTIVAVNGFNAVAKFSSKCVPWMIIIFLAGFTVCMPELQQFYHAGDIHGFGGFMNFLNTYVWNGVVPKGQPRLSIYHVAAFAWMNNMAYHAGLNDMALFRYAKKKSYGFVTAYGMFLGHFFAWGAAGVMGATAAALLNTPIGALDSGAITAATLGKAGLLAVIIAGWTTANPSIYRAALSFQSCFDQPSYKKMAYVVGIVMTIAACFPWMSNIMTIVSIIATIVPAAGAVVWTEHWIIPKLGGTRYWAKFKGWKMNYAGLIAWLIALAFAAAMRFTGLLHAYFIFLPTYCIAIVAYIILALCMGARGDYHEQAEDDAKVQEALKEVMAEEDEEETVSVSRFPTTAKVFRWLSYVVIAVFAVFTCLVPSNIVTVEMYKSRSMLITIIYFVLAALGVIFEYAFKKKEPADPQTLEEEEKEDEIQVAEET